MCNFANHSHDYRPNWTPLSSITNVKQIAPVCHQFAPVTSQQSNQFTKWKQLTKMKDQTLSAFKTVP